MGLVGQTGTGRHLRARQLLVGCIVGVMVVFMVWSSGVGWSLLNFTRGSVQG